jgi:fido (protein-threonine AMPylation protein)
MNALITFQAPLPSLANTTRSLINQQEAMCHNCGTIDHRFQDCPFRSPQRSSEQWKVQAFASVATQEYPFECHVRLNEGKSVLVRSETVEDFWQDITVAFYQSLFRDFIGIKQQGSQTILPPDTLFVKPGRYSLVARSHYWNDLEFDHVLQAAVDKLNALRPLVSPEVLHRIEEELVLQFNHFSLTHEGNSLMIDEIRLLTELLRNNDWKIDANLEEEAASISDSKDDVTEAINHIVLSHNLQETAEQELTEELVLDLHGKLMQGLLLEEKEGLAGMYRKVKVHVCGSTIQTEHPDLITHSMEEFFDDTLVREEGEKLFDYLARVHTAFQYIHPFRDGNGRIGRIIMNILLIKQGYPLMTLPTTLSSLFNHAVGLGVYGLEYHLENGEKLFSRLLAEAVFSSLQAYGNAIGEQLLPNIEEVFGMENVQLLSPLRVVSPQLHTVAHYELMTSYQSATCKMVPV